MVRVAAHVCRFADAVANPSDILLWWKKAGGGRGAGAGAATAASAAKEALSAALRPMAPGAAGASAGLSVRMEDLVGEQLKTSSMALLEEDDLTRGLRMYVEGQADSIKETIDGLVHDRLPILRATQLPRISELLPGGG